MKRFLVLLVLFVGVPTTITLSTSGRSLKHPVIVDSFKDETEGNAPAEVIKMFEAWLTADLKNSFSVVLAKNLETEPDKKKDRVVSSQQPEPKDTPPLKRAPLMIKGSITRFDTSLSQETEVATISATIHVVESSSGRVLASRDVQASAPITEADKAIEEQDGKKKLSASTSTGVARAIQTTVQQAKDFVTAEIQSRPWTGTVLLVEGYELFVNRGAREGVKKGQRFSVGHPKELRDPDTGELLFKTIVKVGTIEVKEVEQKISICHIVAGAGKIKAGMTILPR